MRKFLIVFLVLFWASARGQAISGFVYDSESKQPLLGASVYFDGSSVGTVTNENGFFRLEPKIETTASLIITYIGYSSATIEYYDLDDNLKIGLKVDVFEIPEVIVKSDPFSRRQKLELFRKEFLGDAEIAEDCKILNEDDLELFFNSSDNTLLAHAKKPLIVENGYLGYKIKFDLREFRVAFRSRSLVRLDNIFTTLIKGYSFFQDVSESNDEFKFVSRREKVFEGSIQHLMRNIWNQNWTDNKFKFVLGKKTVLPAEVFKVSSGSALENKKVELPEKKVVVIFKKFFNYRSTLNLISEKKFYIDKYGNYYPYNNVVIGGYLSSSRIDKLLPFDYEYKRPSN